jgi:hypothetical protein
MSARTVNAARVDSDLGGALLAGQGWNKLNVNLFALAGQRERSVEVRMRQFRVIRGQKDQPNADRLRIELERVVKFPLNDLANQSEIPRCLFTDTQP